MKILITGANGFIGQNLVEHLSKRGEEVWAMIRPGSMPAFEMNDKIRVVWADVGNRESLDGVMVKDMVVVNLAANPYDPELSYQVNVVGLKNLVAVAEKVGVRKLIQISSQATKIENKGVYAQTKIKADGLVTKSSIKWVILKPSLVYGAGDKGLFNRIRTMLSMLPFVPVFGDGETGVNPILVDDLCRYIELVISDSRCHGVVYDIGCKQAVSYNQLYREIIRSLKKNNFLLHIPVWVGLLAGNIFKILRWKSPPFYIDNVLGSTQVTNCDVNPIAKRYNYYPREFGEGLKEVFNARRVRVGLVGLGKMGMVHLAALNTIDGVEVVALIDSNKKSWTVVKGMVKGGNFYTDLNTALEKENLEAIYVLTPTFTHKPILLECLKKGLWVFVEKPLGLNMGEINDLEKVATKYPGKVFAGYTLLFKRSIKKIHELLLSGKYGKVLGFEASYVQGEVFGPKKGWMFSKPRSGGGVLMNPGPHLFSVVTYLFGFPKGIGSEIKKIYSSEIDDEAKIKFNYEGYSGNLFLSWSTKGVDIPQIKIEIQLEKAKITTDGRMVEVDEGRKKVIYQERELAPWIKGMYELNPEASGEAYVTEDYLFISQIRSKKRQTILPVNDLGWVLGMESLIHKSYQVAKKK